MRPVMRLWHRIDVERKMVLDRLVTSRSYTAAGALERMNRKGEAWLRELGARRGGIVPDDVELLTGRLAETTVPNMLGLVEHDAASPADAIAGGIAAGVGTALFVGFDLAADEWRDAIDELEREGIAPGPVAASGESYGDGFEDGVTEALRALRRVLER